VAHRRLRERAVGIAGQLDGHGVAIGREFVAVVKGEGGRHEHLPVSVDLRQPEAGGAAALLHVDVAGQTYAITQDWAFGGIRASGRCNGRPYTAQIERQGLWLRVAHDGRRIEAQLLSPRAAELLRRMPFKAPPDMSKFLLSPMPGLLVQLAVQPGQKVLAGERLAIIEAMKMENILVATADGVVGELLARQGESLAVDQPILSFA
jgi:propionyl-CoA carboxylase alpha chain